MKLDIQNFALIDHLELDWKDALTVITGETGSGKSIMLGALGLILGQRADLQAVKDAGKKCIVEGHFSLRENAFLELFKQIDHDFDPHTIIRREILPGGKSRAFINDVPATLDQLKSLGSQLIDIHSQHDTRLLTNTAYQLKLIDMYGGHNAQEDACAQAVRHWHERKRSLEALRAEYGGAEDRDYLVFLFQELEELQPKEGELALLEDEWRSLDAVAEIKSAAGGLSDLLDNDETGMLEQMRRVITEMSALSDVSTSMRDLHERTQSAYIELKDVASESYRYADSLEHDPARLLELEARMNRINQLAQKHQCTADELPMKWEELSDKISGIDAFADREAAALQAVNEAQQEAQKRAAALRDVRLATIPLLEKAINDILVELNFSGAIFSIELGEKEMGVDGIDKPTLLFSANEGHRARPLEKVASGGELSRIMLALKASLANTQGLPTLIFDEIDTGISGQTAARVATLLRDMSANVQLVAITHLPQIAAAGHQHLRVEKDQATGKTQTRVRPLTHNERAEEVARMLSGDKVTAVSRKAAEELLEWTRS
jgi:DNA repair protein RecN (Recombination protein N)